MDIVPPLQQPSQSQNTAVSRDSTTTSSNCDAPHLTDSHLLAQWEERQDGVRLLQTVCRLTTSVIVLNFYPVKPILYRLLAMLCINESSELEPELARDCTTALANLAGALLPLEVVPSAVAAIDEVASQQSWKARSCALEFLQVMVASNLAVLNSLPDAASKLVDIVINLLKDPQVEVREKAGKVLGGLIHCQFVSPTQRDTLTKQFTTQVRVKIPKRKKKRGEVEADVNKEESAEQQADWQARHAAAVLNRHSGIVGLCAVVSSCPYDIPPHLPDILMVLGNYLHDPQPIPSTVKRVLQDFKRTHQDNWTEHKEKFTEDQLNVLTDLLVSPSYYA